MNTILSVFKRFYAIPCLSSNFTYTTAFYYAGVNDRTSMTGKKGARIVENDTLKSMRASNLLNERQEKAINALANNLGIDVEFVEAVLLFNTDNVIDMEILKKLLFIDAENNNYSKYSIRRIKNDIRIYESVGETEYFDYYEREDYCSNTKRGIPGNSKLAKIKEDRRAFGYSGKFTIRGGVYKKDNSEILGDVDASSTSKSNTEEVELNSKSPNRTTNLNNITPDYARTSTDPSFEVFKEVVLERLYKDALGATRKVRTKDVTVSDDSGVMYAITREDVKLIQGIGRKSLNDLTESELKQLESVAEKYFEEMGVKSPFFRRWFGDWRANEKKRIKFVSVNSEVINTKDIPNGKFKNNDTNWEIKSNPDGKGETAHKRGKWSDDYHALKDIKAMLSNAILLDTVIASNPSKRMGKNAILVHHLYCPIKTNNKNEFGIAKLYVSEYYDGGKKFYLNKIEKMSSDTRGYVEKITTHPGVKTPHQMTLR